jgi:histone acetyltransferase (RNA polymerase elongator complex component)
VRKIIIPIFIPHKGCPHDCVFCNQKKISGKVVVPKDDEIRTTIRDYIAGAQEGAEIEIAFYGGSFTGIAYEEQERMLAVAYEFRDKISGIRASTRPDCIDDNIIKLLKNYNVNNIELGVQSLDPHVLKKSGRGHTREDVYSAATLLKAAGIGLGLQTMIGLPGDDFEKSIETCKQVISLKPDIVRIYPTLVIKDTPLCDMYYKGEYQPMTLEEAVELTAVLLEAYQKEGINVIRVGLQPTDSVKGEELGGDVVAGPYHPAFRQLSESRIALKQIINEIEIRELARNKEIKILAKAQDPSVIIGQRKGNIFHLKEQYGFERITVVQDKMADSHNYDFVI